VKEVASFEEDWNELEGCSREGETMVGMEGSIVRPRFRRRHPVLDRDRRLERSPAPLPGRED
jgi:hypothetical protein